MKNKNRLLLIGFGLLIIFFAQDRSFAQSGVGNGGGGEALFENQSDMISSWLERQLANGTLFLKLNLYAIPLKGQDFVLSFKNAVSRAHVKFIPAKKLPEACQEGDRLACQLIKTALICISEQKFFKIECNEDFFDVQKGDEQFTLTFHAYLELIKAEGSSQFTIAKKIARYALKVVNSPRWELLDQIVNLCKVSLRVYGYGGTAFQDYDYGNIKSSETDSIFQFLEKKGYTRCNPYLERDCVDAGSSLYMQTDYRRGSSISFTVDLTDAHSEDKVFAYWVDLTQGGLFDHWQPYTDAKAYLFKTRFFPSCAQLNNWVGKKGSKVELKISEKKSIEYWKVQP